MYENVIWYLFYKVHEPNSNEFMYYYNIAKYKENVPVVFPWKFIFQDVLL